LKEYNSSEDESLLWGEIISIFSRGLVKTIKPFEIAMEFVGRRGKITYMLDIYKEALRCNLSPTSITYEILANHMKTNNEAFTKELNEIHALLGVSIDWKLIRDGKLHRRNFLTNNEISGYNS
jgi:hypothetical protein